MYVLDTWTTDLAWLNDTRLFVAAVVSFRLTDARLSVARRSVT